jgi:hypothetical protein
MVVYKAAGIFNYGRSSLKNYMSLHVMPIYGSSILYSRYKIILHKANFQKEGIIYKTTADMPLEKV